MKSNRLPAVLFGAAFKTGNNNLMEKVIFENLLNFLRPLEVAVNGRKQGITKKKQNLPSARLLISKIELLKQFIDVVKQFNINLFENIENMSYRSMKENCEYSTKWKIVKKDIFKVWTSKSLNLNDFNVTD